VTSDRYTHGHHESVLRSHRWRTAANSASYLLPHLAPGQQLLDVGCGPATITADLAELIAPGEVVAIDNAPAAIVAARSTLDERGITNASVRRADVYALPFEPARFDVVHAHQVLQHLVDPVAALVEMRRVCRPEGVVAARDSDYPAMAWYPDHPALDRWLAVYLQIARGNGAEPAAARRLLKWARAAGFGSVEVSASVWCHATPDERQWWGSMWADRVTTSDFADQAVSKGYVTPDELDEMAAAWRAWSIDENGWFSSVHGEIICRP
jgi:ubiquinone/menaquinone biosynthesis C-methylase UbiE